MTPLVSVFRFINLVAIALAAGGFLMELVAFVPVKRSLPAVASAQAQQISSARRGVYVPATVAVAGFSALVIVVLHNHLPFQSGALLVGGMLCNIVMGITSALIEIPLSREMDKDSFDATASEYPQMLETWIRGHQVRTALALFALAFYIASLLAA